MKRYLQILAWLSGAVGVVFIALGIIAFLGGGKLFTHRWDNYFYPAGIFLHLGIFLFLGHLACNKNKQLTEAE